MTHYDILIIGAGSGNTIPGPEFADKTIAQVEKAKFGGTCLNYGCIPTKMFVHTANLAATPAGAGRFGLNETLDSVDWPAIRDRIFGRIDPISVSGENNRRNNPSNSNITVYKGTGRFTGPKQLDVDGETLTADTVILAAGARATMPPIEGLVDAKPLTSDTVMRLESLPQSMIILGSGFVAAEMGHVLASLGVKVTIVARSGALLRKEDSDISLRYTEAAASTCNLRLNFHASKVVRTVSGVVLEGTGPEGFATIEADEILVAVGRTPNSDVLAVEAAGIDTYADGRVVVDEYQRVIGGGKVLDDVWALGDICSPFQLKHVANHEARTVKHNITNSEMIASDHRFVPHAVFGNPPVASVGLTEDEARAQGFDVVIGMQKYADIAYGWAMEDTRDFAKIIAERGTSRILGAHIIGPEAPTLIQPLIQAMSTGQSARDIARTQYWIHPAMPELVENALLKVIS